MALPAEKQYLTTDEYRALERTAVYKSEYFNSEMFAMAGGSRRHSIIAANLIRELGLRLKGKPCVVHTSDMRIFVKKNGLETYPDASVVCSRQDKGSSADDVITDPVVIVEVLSKSSAAYDRGAKFELYRELDSFSDYLLVDQDRVFVEYFHRAADGTWTLQVFRDLQDTLELKSISGGLPLAEVYDKINW